MIKTSSLLRARAILKTITWRILASVITVAIVYFLTGRIMLALSVIGIEVLTKSLLYYAHEKGWSLTDSPKKGTKKRSVFKTVTWRIVASLDTLIIILFFTGEPLCATSATGLEIILKTIFYYLHERIWNHFRLETIHLDLHTHSTCSDGTLSPQ